MSTSRRRRGRQKPPAHPLLSAIIVAVVFVVVIITYATSPSTPTDPASDTVTTQTTEPYEPYAPPTETYLAPTTEPYIPPETYSGGGGINPPGNGYVSGPGVHCGFHGCNAHILPHFGWHW